jgi:LPS sulfotransferase NodH
VRYIWLRRRDTLRQAISLYRAAATDIWHWPAGAPRPMACPVFDAERIEHCRREITIANDYWRDWFAGEAARSPLELWYEDISADPRAAIEHICRHIGLSTENLPTPQSKLCVMRDAVTDEWCALLRHGN